MSGTHLDAIVGQVRKIGSNTVVALRCGCRASYKNCRNVVVALRHSCRAIFTGWFILRISLLFWGKKNCNEALNVVVALRCGCRESQKNCRNTVVVALRHSCRAIFTGWFILRISLLFWGKKNCSNVVVALRCGCRASQKNWRNTVVALRCST